MAPRSVSTEGTSQIPLDGPYGKPASSSGRRITIRLTRLAPRRCRPPQPDPSEEVPGPRRFRHNGRSGHQYVLRDFRSGDYRNVYDLPGPLRPTPGESGMVIRRARLRGVDHPPGGSHPRPGEAVLTLLSASFFSSPAGFLRLAAGLWPGILAPGPPPPDRRASRLSTRCLSSAIISSSVSRLAPASKPEFRHQVFSEKYPTGIAP